MTELLSLAAHDRSYQIEDPGGLIGHSLRNGAAYEMRVLEHIFRQDLSGLAVDVGASCGNHTLWLAVVCGMRVVAVEPLDHERLARNVALNELGDRVEVWPFALGDRSYRGAVTGAPAHVVGEGIPGDGLVRIERLDDFALSDVALVKVDVEGMERAVLLGAAKTITRDRPLIYVEAVDAEAHAGIAEILEPLGYQHTKTFGATPLEEWRP